MNDKELSEQQKKDAVVDFLRRCIEYADETIAKKTQSADDPEELAKWLAYRDYTDYALKEVESGELNHWFTLNS
jgi:hypothetical protein